MDGYTITHATFTKAFQETSDVTAMSGTKFPAAVATVRGINNVEPWTGIASMRRLLNNKLIELLCHQKMGYKLLSCND